MVIICNVEINRAPVWEAFEKEHDLPSESLVSYFKRVRNNMAMVICDRQNQTTYLIGRLH